MRTVVAELDPAARPGTSPIFEVGAAYEFHFLEWNEGTLGSNTAVKTVRAVSGSLIRVVSTTEVRIEDESVQVVEVPDYAEEIVNTASLAFVKAVRTNE